MEQKKLQTIMLDAENLAEYGIRSAYLALLDRLKQWVPNPIDIEEEVDDLGDTYAIRVQGVRYVVFGDGGPSMTDEGWVTATIILFDIVNMQLERAGAEVRFYQISSGNGLAGVFLKPNEAKLLKKPDLSDDDWW